MPQPARATLVLASAMLLLAPLPTGCGDAPGLAQAAPAVAPQSAPRRAPATPPANPTLPPPVPAGGTSAGPIVADPPGVNFGVVEPGTVVSATIKLVNPLDQPVRIKVAKPSCTCTTVDMVGKVIPAKGMLEMPMSMKTSKSVGNRSAQINLVFEGIEQLLAVRIDAETAYSVRANPAFVDALVPERMKGYFEVLSSDGTPFSVLSVDGRAPIAPDGAPLARGTRQVLAYDFTNLGGRPVPPFLVVETDHPKAPLIDLRVRHETTRIAPALNFAEFRQNLGVLKSGGSTEFEVEIKKLGAARVTAVAPRDARSRCELLEQRADGESVLVKVRFTDQGLPKGVFLFPCRLTAGQTSADLWLYGCVR
ncbi:MAG: DUF1573 domain-containing protein [Planctomycetota bacterium]